MADDPVGFNLGADHEARHVHQEEQRNPEGVAEVDETRGLVGRVVVEDAAEMARLVGDDSDRPTAEASEAGDDRLCELRLHVKPLTVINDLGDHVVHVVRLAVRFRERVKQRLFGALDRIGALLNRRRLFAICRHVGEVLLNRLDAGLVGLNLKVANA